MESSEDDSLVLYEGEDLNNSEGETTNFITDLINQEDRLISSLKDVTNNLIPERERNKELKLEFQTETEKCFKLKRNTEMTTEVITDIQALLEETDVKFQNLRDEIIYKEKGEIEYNTTIRNCKDLVRKLENKFECINIENKHKIEQKDLEIATVQKKIKDTDEFKNQKNTEDNIKIKTLEDKVLLLDENVAQQNEEFPASKNEMQLKLLDMEKKLEIIDLKERSKTEKLKNLQNEYINLKLSKDKEEEDLKEKLQYLMKGDAEEEEKLNNLLSEDANLSLEIMRLDSQAEFSAQRKKELEEHIAEKNSLIEEAQNAGATLEKKCPEELNILTKNNEDVDLKISNITKLKEELVLRIKENNEEHERSLQEEYSLRGEIEVESNNLNMMKAKTIENLKNRISSHKIFRDYTVKLNTFNLQLAERKKGYNKKSCTFREELNKIIEDSSNYEISFSKDLEDIKEEYKTAAEDFEAFEKRTLDEIAQLTNIIECMDQDNSKRKPKPVIDTPKTAVVDVDSDTSMISIGRPTMQDVLRERKLQ